MLFSNNLWPLCKDWSPTTRQQFHEHLSNNFINQSISPCVGFLQLQVPLSYELLSHDSLCRKLHLHAGKLYALCTPPLSPFTLEGNSHLWATSHGLEKQPVLLLLRLKTWLGTRWWGGCVFYTTSPYIWRNKCLFLQYICKTIIIWLYCQSCAVAKNQI